MAKCKICHRKGYTVETDVNGLCTACAPYYYLTMSDDLKALNRALKIIGRAGGPDHLAESLAWACQALDRIRPYARAGLADLPMPLAQIEQLLEPYCPGNKQP